MSAQAIGKMPMLKGQDIADAVHYVLSTPEDVQVSVHFFFNRC